MHRRIVQVVALIALLAFAAPALAQDVTQGALPPPPQPVMQNVFYNVVWGSLFGALVGFSSAVLASSDKTNPSGTHEALYEGATLGGLTGLGVALYLVYAGITFNPNGSTLTYQQSGPAPLQALAPAELPLVSFEMAPERPGAITGVSARILNLHF
ncbi:MAG TPA: hypothetical protein VL359_17545 [bacterium]|nr:hypothetical protein [bacterium]